MYSQSKAIVVIVVVLSFVSTFAVVLRFCAQHESRRRRGWKADEYMIVAALFLIIATAILEIVGVAIGGLGAPADAVLSDQVLINFNIIQWTDEFAYVLGVGLIKVSILLYYRRIFVTRVFKLIANCTVAFVAVWMLVFLLVSIFQAKPFSWNWTGVGQVINLNDFFVAEVATNIFLDIFILCLPMPIVSRLQMSAKRKLVIVGILALGFFCTVASCVRLWYFTKFIALQSSPTAGPADLLNINFKMLVWAFIEPSASVVCACLPTLGPLFRGGRSAESLVNSVVSVFSRRSEGSLARKNSRGSSSSGHATYDQSTSPSKHAYLDSNAGFTNIESVQREKTDLNRPGVITVETSLSLNSGTYEGKSSYV